MKGMKTDLGHCINFLLKNKEGLFKQLWEKHKDLEGKEIVNQGVSGQTYSYSGRVEHSENMKERIEMKVRQGEKIHHRRLDVWGWWNTKKEMATKGMRQRRH